MTLGGHDAFDDPYCYKGAAVLKNRLGTRDVAAFRAFEAEMTALRAEEPLPRGRLGTAHYCAIHHHLFQDVYRWAGRYRTVRTSKSGNVFCYPEHISHQMQRLFMNVRQQHHLRGLDRNAFLAAAAEFLAELNAIHPFREGNGRIQLIFMNLLSAQAGHPLTLTRIRQRNFLAAMIASFHGDLAPLRTELSRLLARG